MDTRRLIGEVAARHGVRLDEDDPALVLVTLTDLMLQDARAQFTAAVQTAISEYQDAADRVQARAGAAMAGSVRAAIQEFRPQQWQVDHWSPRIRALVGLALFFGGFAVGRILTP